MKEEWLAFEWPGVYLYQLVVPAPAWAYGFAKYSRGLSKMALTHEQGTSSAYVIRREYEGCGQDFFPKVKNNPAIMYSHIVRTRQAAQEIFKLGQKWNWVDFGALSDKELLARHQKLFRWDKQLWQEGQVQNMLELHNSYVTTYIKTVIARTFFDQDAIKTFGILTTGTYHMLTEQQDQDFVKLVGATRNLKPNSALFTKVLKRHWQKYSWMTYGWAGPAIPIESFRANILAARGQPGLVREIQKRQTESRRALHTQRSLYKNLNATDKKLAILLRDLLDIKAERIDAHSQTYFLADRINAQIAKRTGLSVNQVRTIPPAEVPAIFKHPEPERLNREWDFALFWYERGWPVKKYVGLAGRKKFQYIQARLPKVKATNELTGELAYPGKVRGKVRLILNIKEAAKFKPGEILVTRITDPSYVPIMKKARAIVTDIGGITSHAAIVSRELRKPCIVGTQIGTKVLKDGDRVEVNATQGIVKKI